MRIERIDIGRINVGVYNPRKDLQPGDREYQELERSIARWDSVEPLVWNQRTGNLVSGHQRLKILRARGDTEVDVSVVALDPPEEMALNLALNKTGGTWDDQKLFEALSNLNTTPDLLVGTGFDSESLGALAESLNVALFTPAEPAPLDAPAVTDADVAAAQKTIDRKFDRTQKVEEVMCPHCGQTFGYKKGDARHPVAATEA